MATKKTPTTRYCASWGYPTLSKLSQECVGTFPNRICDVQVSQRTFMVLLEDARTSYRNFNVNGDETTLLLPGMPAIFWLASMPEDTLHIVPREPGTSVVLKCTGVTYQ